MSETLTVEQSMAEANRILSDAGWTPIPNPVWGDGFVAGPLVGGVTPDGATQLVKNIAAVMPGDLRYGPDTPDEHHEAAAWLVATHGGVKKAFHVERAPEPMQDAVHEEAVEDHGEAGAADQSSDVSGDVWKDGQVEPITFAAPIGAKETFAAGVDESGARLSAPAESSLFGNDPTAYAAGSSVGNGSGLVESVSEFEAFDVDFTEHEALAFEAEMAEAEAQADPAPPQDRFIGLDDLDRRRSLRMGDVMRYARSLMPYWSTNEDAALAELRNFAMGVSEGRWADDPERSAELDALEATLRRMRAIETARDVKVEFLEAASRADLEAFDPEAGWP